jgi:outer membrane protein assembly factor BamD (BamD/ComL family)
MIQRILSLLACTVIFLALPARAAFNQPDDVASKDPTMFGASDPFADIDHKEPSMWHAARAETPSGQLAIANAYETNGQVRSAIRANNALVHEWHSSPEAVQSQQNMARLLEEDGQYKKAFAEYEYMMVYFPGQFNYTNVLDHQYRCANALATENGTFLGLSVDSMAKVRCMYEHILRNGPHWEKAPEVALHIGTAHETDDEPVDAVMAYEQAQNRFPGTDAARDAAYLAAQVRIQYSFDHPRDAQSRAMAIAALKIFEHAYPFDARCASLTASRKELESTEMDARYEQAVFYDRNRKEPAAAVAAYRDFLRAFPDAPQARTAEARMAELESVVKANPKQEPSASDAK